MGEIITELKLGGETGHLSAEGETDYLSAEGRG